MKRTTIGILVLAAAVTAASLAPGPHARATVLGGAALPAEPTVCDSVQLVAQGHLPNPCYTVRGFRVGDPEPVPTMGPIPVYRLVGVIRTEEPNPALDVACPAVIEPYRVSKELGRLRPGHYLVEFVEYLHPFPADSTSPIDSSRAYLSFVVNPDTCRTVPGCVLLGFAKSGPETDRADGCTARVAPGGRACFDVTLMNDESVAALQTVVALPPGEAFVYDFANLIVPVEVATTSRTQGFQVAWQRDDTKTKIVLYSTAGGAIPPGSGPILHLCYDVKEGIPERTYDIAFGPTLVSTPEEDVLPHCPTFREVRGRLCVVGDGCDVNDDGENDVRDIVRMVGCVLSGPACPDSVRERSDCNGDGSVDVRDVVCCVRHILTRPGSWGPDFKAQDSPPEKASIDFEGEATWANPFDGHAVVTVDRGGLFAGIQFIVQAWGPVQIRNVDFQEPQAWYSLHWEPGPDGIARVMVYPRGPVPAGSGSGPMRLRLTLAASGGSAEPGHLRIDDFRAATKEGGVLGVTADVRDLVVPASSATGVATILPARPNPFVSDTEISFALPAETRASVRLFDARGRLVRTLHDGIAAAGVHRVRWDGRDDRGRNAGVGIYFVRLTAGAVVRTDRILRLR